MDWSALLDQLSAAHMPALPTGLAMQFGRHLVWAGVLCGFGLNVSRRVGPLWRWTLLATLALWVLVPGPASPAYWLSLAFQTPSLVAAALCLWLGRAGGGRNRTAVGHWADAPTVYVLTGVVLGWILLLDVFALWPVSVYVLGFGWPALGLLALLACAPWLLRPDAWRWSAAAGLVLLLFVLTRLPSGNLWDALLDPWLWIALQLGLLRRLWVRFNAAAATRA